MLRLILADEDTLVRQGLKMLLVSHKHFDIVDEASNGMQVLQMIERGLVPDIVITEIDMPEMNGISLASNLKRKNDQIKVIMLSSIAENKTIEQSFASGALAYLLKSIRPEELIFAINQVSLGNRYLCSDLAIALLEDGMKQSNSHSPDIDPTLDLSSREMEVLLLTAEGLTNSEMSDRLFLSKRTIEGHRQSLIEKTGCRNTAALIRFALVNGIIQ